MQLSHHREQIGELAPRILRLLLRFCRSSMAPGHTISVPIVSPSVYGPTAPGDSPTGWTLTLMPAPPSIPRLAEPTGPIYIAFGSARRSDNGYEASAIPSVPRAI